MKRLRSSPRTERYCAIARPEGTRPNKGKRFKIYVNKGIKYEGVILPAAARRGLLASNYFSTASFEVQTKLAV